MKVQKLRLGLVALLLGFGLVITQSAFTPKLTTLYVLTEEGDFIPDTEAGGRCLEDFTGETCKYVLIPNSDPSDPNNYMPAPGYEDQRWVP